MKRAVVTGASGFIGRHLVGALREAGWATTTVSRRSNSTNASHYVLGADPWEITSLITMLDALSPDVVFHMAGTMRAGFASDMYMTNTILAARLLDAVERSQKRPSVVLAGSAAEYGSVGCERMPVS